MCMDLCRHVYRHVYRPECMHVYRHAYRHVCRHAYRHVCRHVYKHVFRHVYRHVHRHVYRHVCTSAISALHRLHIGSLLALCAASTIPLLWSSLFQVKYEVSGELHRYTEAQLADKFGVADVKEGMPVQHKISGNVGIVLTSFNQQDEPAGHTIFGLDRADAEAIELM